MKLRLDFVTNSSSSSFVCLGVRMEKRGFLEIEDVVYNKECDLDCWSSCYSYDGDPMTVGISFYDLFKKYPEAKMKELPKIVSDELNKWFDTEYTEKDIVYIEECEYNG